jgi:hypothetical protein
LNLAKGQDRGDRCVSYFCSPWVGEVILFIQISIGKDNFFSKKLNRDYAAVMATAVKNWFWKVSSGEDIPNWPSVINLGESYAVTAAISYVQSQDGQVLR